MEYKASFDNITKTITIAIIIIVALIGQIGVKEILNSQEDSAAVLFNSAMIVLFIAIIVFAFLFSTQKYVVSDTELIIKRPIGDRKILISDIEEIRVLEKGELAGAIRLFGNGGFFGYYGIYRNKRFGTMTLYTTRRSNRVFIRTKSGHRIVISPDDLSLVEQVKRG